MLRFLVVGGVSYVVDIATLYGLHGRAGLPLVPSTAAALTTGLLANFTLNRWVVFGAARDGTRVHAQLVRYAVLVAANYALTLATVSLLAGAGVEYLIAKSISTGANAVLNFFAYRLWVFRPSAGHGPTATSVAGD